MVITGGTGGIGKATAEKFKNDKGWKVVVWGKEDVDVTDLLSVKQAFKSVFEKNERIDCLINCAGIFGNRTLAEYDTDSINKVMAINECGTYYCCQVVLEYMKSGSIVNISSVAGEVGSGSDPIYAATKGAVLAFSKSLAKALAPNIRVNCVAPGITDTGMLTERKWTDIAFDVDQTPLGRMAVPGDIANAIYFLANDQSSHVTGATLDVNGGALMR